MRSSARVNVIGHLGADAELSFLTSGDPILAFRVAHTPPREGQPEHTNWYRCTLLGRRAEALQPYLVTGMPVFVHGDLDVREYRTTHAGETRSSLDLKVGELELLESRADRQERFPASKQGQKPAEAVDDDSRLAVVPVE
jgi:single-strand DNA-binding protein